MRKSKVTVIGTINRDTILFPDGRRTESFGGILYNLSALSALGGTSLEISPVCNVGYDVFAQVKVILKGFGNVRPDGIKRVRRKNNHALLVVDEESQRQEVLKNRVPVLSFSRVEPFLDCDLVLVNFISGFDISLSTLRKIRRSTDALIFMDIHSLTLGVRRDGRRFLRTPRSWRDYVRQADFLQANLTELHVLSGTRVNSSNRIRDFGKDVLSLGPKAVLLTLGEEGALMVYRHGKGCRLKREKGIRVRAFKDATGAGDVFSAGFLIRYLESGNLARSLDFANRVAAEKCKVSGVEGIPRLLRKLAHQ
jgi:sugar/nucleoside kinase (ribokinase family)